jgi:hypothetical protein
VLWALIVAAARLGRGQGAPERGGASLSGGTLRKDLASSQYCDIEMSARVANGHTMYMYAYGQIGQYESGPGSRMITCMADGRKACSNARIA